MKTLWRFMGRLYNGAATATEMDVAAGLRLSANNCRKGAIISTRWPVRGPTLLAITALD